MTAWLLVAAGLAGCQSEAADGPALSAAECSQLNDRMNQLVTAGVGVDMAEVEDASHRKVVLDACAAGETYTRKDFECVNDAANMEQMNECNLLRHL
ncbi:hypothetical protein ACFFGH_03630 [Lysobacter korlensis]|uniref:Lipoprotein n=1 Tax=Lysobacter korlensis TaxID=553636 RepID=A0ABV6RK39_9GAMM